MTRRTLLPIAGVAVVCAGLAIWATTRPDSDEVGSAKPIRHIVLVTIDTLRADALSLYREGGVETPALARLAREGTLFSRATAPSPWTRPSITSMLTGLPARVHGLVGREFDHEGALPPEIRTLAERLASAGYRTGAFGYNPFLANSATLRRGFRTFVFEPFADDNDKDNDDSPKTRMTLDNSTKVLTSLATRWITDHADEPFFLWLHYYDPHHPYAAPPRFRRPLPDGARHAREDYHDLFVETLRSFRIASSRKAGFRTRPGPIPPKPLTAEDGPALRALYDEEVRFVDARFARVLDAIDRLGLADDTLVVVTSDHGEEFWEHGALEHGHALHEEVLHIPLIARWPGGRSQRVDERVSLMSMYPTLLEAAGLTAAPEQSVVPSLLPTVKDGVPPPALAELVVGNRLFGEPEDGVYLGDLKFTRARTSGEEALYDLAKDPLEKNNLVERDPTNAARGRERLDAFTAWAAEQRKLLKLRHARAGANSEAAKKLLREHGYLR